MLEMFGLILVAGGFGLFVFAVVLYLLRGIIRFLKS